MLVSACYWYASSVMKSNEEHHSQHTYHFVSHKLYRFERPDIAYFLLFFQLYFFRFQQPTRLFIFMIVALLARTISHPSYMVRLIWEREKDYCSRHAEWKIIDENEMEPKSQRSHFNVRKCSILSILPSATSAAAAVVVVLCRQNSICLLPIYLYSFGSTQLLIGIFAIRCWMHEQQFLICVAGLALLGLAWAHTPSVWFSICVILIFQFSTCLRRTTNKTKTKYRQLNAEWTANSSLRSLTLYPAVCFIVPNASSEFIVYFFSEASTPCTK